MQEEQTIRQKGVEILAEAEISLLCKKIPAAINLVALSFHCRYLGMGFLNYRG